MLTCDFIIKENGFDFCHYIHPSEIHDLPFFIHARAIRRLNFSNDSSIFQTQLQNMRNRNCPLFHIAEPILTLDNSL